MGKKFLYAILIFLFSMGIGFVFSKMWINQKLEDANLQLVGDNFEISNVQGKETNEIIKNVSINSDEVVETASSEEKLSPNAEFALKKFYNECGHFKFEYAELPKELVNLTKEQIDSYYSDWKVDEFSSNRLVLVKEIASLCDEHFIIKLGEKYVQIFHLESDGNLVLYKTTDISRDYLPQDDISKLEKGIYVFGAGKLNSVLEDFE